MLCPENVNDPFAVRISQLIGSHDSQAGCAFLSALQNLGLVLLQAAASAPEKTSLLGKASLNMSEYGSGLRNPWTTIQVEMEGKGAEANAELKVSQGGF